MIKVTVDIFSGRPNPTWIMHDSGGDELIKRITQNSNIVTKPDSGYDGLGYRGITIEAMGDEKIGKLPAAFSIANGLLEDQKESLDIARTIVDQMIKYEKYNYDMSNITPINKAIQKTVFGSIDQFEKDLQRIRKYIDLKEKLLLSSAIRVTVNDAECDNKCQYEESKFNPNFWNADANVRYSNNCYNYGRNWKTNTFAQPGRFSGQMAANMTCPEVKAAAMRDGLHKRCDCLPQSEYPRRLMALVVAPGVDYHWYRKQKDGFWGHKPGGTAAKNVDNQGVVITDPRTCDRGSGTALNYTDFCGFFYAGKSVIIR
jgi:hypothetical protein